MLTEKQERFCINYLETGNATEAYRRSYNAEGMNDNTIGRKAHGLLKQDKIRARLAGMRQPLIEVAECSFEQHMIELATIRDEAREAGQFGAAVTAEVNRGKAAGHYTERVEITAKLAHLSDEELDARLQYLIEQNKGFLPA